MSDPADRPIRARHPKRVEAKPRARKGVAGRSAPSVENLRVLAAALGLDLADADLERLRPEVESLWRHAARLRRLPLGTVSPLRDRHPE